MNESSIENKIELLGLEKYFNLLLKYYKIFKNHI